MTEDPKIQKYLSEGYHVLAWKKTDTVAAKYLFHAKGKQALYKYAAKIEKGNAGSLAKMGVYSPTPNKNINLVKSNDVTKIANLIGHNGNIQLRQTWTEGAASQITLTESEIIKILKAHPNVSNIIKACLRK